MFLWSDAEEFSDSFPTMKTRFEAPRFTPVIKTIHSKLNTLMKSFVWRYFLTGICITVQRPSMCIVHIHKFFFKISHIQTNVEDISTIIPHFYILIPILNKCLFANTTLGRVNAINHFPTIRSHRGAEVVFQIFTKLESQKNGLHYLFRYNPVFTYCNCI